MSSSANLAPKDLQQLAELRRRLREQAEGHEVVSASDGAEALEKLRAGLRPALIFLDVMMPRMNGLALKEEMARDALLDELNVLMLSADPRALKKAEALPGVRVISKPISLDTLLAAAREATRGT